MEKQEIAQPLASYAAARIVQISPSTQLLYISGTTARQTNGHIPPFGATYDEKLAALSAIEIRQQHKWSSATAIQTDIILAKITSVINDASEGRCGLEAMVELTIFVKELERDYGAVNEVYNARIGELLRSKGMPLPARTCVQVSAMPPDERTLVEMKGVAVIKTVS